ncbi:hypothetical protein DTO013F2_8656 [Penicillium roqueforti]|nr:hypothetical protein DTO013F2_8656 [Penicillium roqueforti]
MLTLALATAVAATPRPVLNVQPAINVVDSVFLSHGSWRALDAFCSQIQLLNGMLDKIISTPDDSEWTRNLKAIRSARFQSDIDHLYTMICRYRDTLSSYEASRYHKLRPVDVDSALQPIIEVPDSRLSPAFVGREDILSDLEYCFDNHEGKPRVVVLRAMGGQGKTQIALKFCQLAFCTRRGGNRRYHAIFWVDATTQWTVRKSFKNIRAAVETTVQQAQFDEEDERMYVRRMMRSWSFPWLMVLDTYDNPLEFNIADFMMFRGHGDILITTRHENESQWGKVIDVPGLPEDDALILLMEQCNAEEKADNVQEGQEIIKRLGYLPLAIHQAAAYIWKHPPIHSFLATYESEKKNVMKWIPSVWVYNQATDRERESALSVLTTWELSVGQITDDATRKKTEQFLTVCAYLGKSNTSEDLIKASSSSTDQWLELFLRDGKWDSRQYSEIAIKLRGLALVHPASGGSNSFSVHPMVADWLKCSGEGSSPISEKKLQLDRISAATLLKNYLQLQVASTDLSHEYMNMPFDARALQSELFRPVYNYLQLTLGGAPHLFSSLHELEGLGRRLGRKPISSEQELEAYERFAVEEHINDIITELCKIPAARDELGLGDGIQFSNHTNSLNDNGAIEANTTQPSSVYHPRPDQFCIHRVDRNTTTLLTSVEYKPPHKLSVATLRMGLRPMDLWKDMVRSNKIPTNQEAKLRYNAERLICPALVQEYHVMIQEGLEYSYVTNGIARVLLCVRQNDPGTLYYFLCDPNSEVNMEMEATFANSSVVRTLFLCLMAFHSPMRGQEWRNSVRSDIPIWKTSFDHTRSHIPEDEFPQLPLNSDSTAPEFLSPDSGSTYEPSLSPPDSPESTAR